MWFVLFLIWTIKRLSWFLKILTFRQYDIVEDIVNQISGKRVSTVHRSFAAILCAKSWCAHLRRTAPHRRTRRERVATIANDVFNSDNSAIEPKFLTPRAATIIDEAMDGVCARYRTFLELFNHILIAESKHSTFPRGVIIICILTTRMRS